MSHRTLPAELCRRVLILSLALLVVGILSLRFNGPQIFPHAHAQAGGTRLLRTPTVSATQIAFAYAQNIWVVPRAGGIARRVTSFQGQTGNPHFSPDGKWIAFSGEYAGNLDVYVVAADGGEPKRLTWHPGGDLVQGWTPDGKSVFFVLARDLVAEWGAALLDGACCRRRRTADGSAAWLSGKDFRRRHTHRLSHEQFLG